MSEINDPRTHGFNYGPGWSGPFPPLYLTGVRIAHVLGRQAANLSNKAWLLEMAVRDVRLACTGTEKAVAIGRLQDALADYLPDKPFFTVIKGDRR